MGSIFRTATTQAILDIIAEHGSKTRFGQLFTEGDAEALASRVVDLFEMTLELRSRTSLIGATATPGPTDARTSQGKGTSQNMRQAALPAYNGGKLRGARKSWNEEETAAPFPTTVHASEFTDIRRPKIRTSDLPPDSEDPGAFTLRLPRQRKNFSEEERQNFLKRR